MRIQAEKPLISSPLCRHRVIYLGNKTATETKNGLESVQEPLKLLYSTGSNVDGTKRGVDAWLSVTACGLELEFVEQQQKKAAVAEEAEENDDDDDDDDEEEEEEVGEKKKNQRLSFFPIENLHYCAAVRFVDIAVYNGDNDNNNDNKLINENYWKKAKFLPLDNPLASLNNSSQHPPLFVAVVRSCLHAASSVGQHRKTERSTTDCMAFICHNSEVANGFVRYCFRAYADSMASGEITNIKEHSIGMAGELNGAIIVGGGNEGEKFSKTDQDNALKGDKSKSGRRWSNIKSKYYHKFRKKNMAAVSTNETVDKVSSEPALQNISNIETATEVNQDEPEECHGSFRRLFKKNKKRMSQSEANLNTNTAFRSATAEQQQQPPQQHHQQQHYPGNFKPHEANYNKRRHFSCHQLPMHFTRIIPIVNHPRCMMPYCSFLDFSPPVVSPAHFPYINLIPQTAFYGTPVFTMYPPFQTPQFFVSNSNNNNNNNNNITTSSDNDSSDCSYDSSNHVLINRSQRPHFYNNKNKSLPVERERVNSNKKNNAVDTTYCRRRNGDNPPPDGAATANKNYAYKLIVDGNNENNKNKCCQKKNNLLEPQHRNERASSFKSVVQRQKTYGSSPSIFYNPSTVQARSGGGSAGKAFERSLLLSRQRQDFDYSPKKAIKGGCFGGAGLLESNNRNSVKTVEERIQHLNISEGDDDEFLC